MNFSFHPEAEEEFQHAIEYYDSKDDGLGYAFAIEIYAAIQRAAEFPKAWSLLDGGIRRSLARRFPFGVLYAYENKQLFIVAVMNLHRSPNYWKKRR